MRFVPAFVLLLAATTTLLTAAPRAWRAATWAERTDDRTYRLETTRDVITVEPAEGSTPAPEATVGTALRFVVEGQQVVVLDADEHEHTFTLRTTQPKYAASYNAVGGGHYIKSVAPAGRQVTLEDGTRWDIDPRRTFAVTGWQPDDLITVRREPGEPDYGFTLENTTQDDGVLANYRVVR